LAIFGSTDKMNQNPHTRRAACLRELASAHGDDDSRFRQVPTLGPMQMISRFTHSALTDPRAFDPHSATPQSLDVRVLGNLESSLQPLVGNGSHILISMCVMPDNKLATLLRNNFSYSSRQSEFLLHIYDTEINATSFVGQISLNGRDVNGKIAMNDNGTSLTLVTSQITTTTENWRVEFYKLELLDNALQVTTLGFFLHPTFHIAVDSYFVCIDNRRYAITYVANLIVCTTTEVLHVTTINDYCCTLQYCRLSRSLFTYCARTLCMNVVDSVTFQHRHIVLIVPNITSINATIVYLGLDVGFAIVTWNSIVLTDSAGVPTHHFSPLPANDEFMRGEICVAPDLRTIYATSYCYFNAAVQCITIKPPK
jgi:hypothetical protein